MSNISDPKDLNLIPNAYTGSDGNFGVVLPVAKQEKSCPKWYGCREEFAAACEPHFSGFLFFHTNKTTEDIAEFVEKFEVLLERGRGRPIHRSTFQKVNSHGVIGVLAESHMTWVNPGPFWTKQPMRHSMLTLLLRCANNGYTVGGNFFQALFCSYNLAMGCKSAIARFLDGYTWYTGDLDGKTNGWYAAFHPLEGSVCTDKRWKNLIKPKKKSEVTQEEVTATRRSPSSEE